MFLLAGIGCPFGIPCDLDLGYTGSQRLADEFLMPGTEPSLEIDTWEAFSLRGRW